MNSVENLSSNPFPGLSYEEKQNIRKLGRRVPDLNIVQNITTASSLICYCAGHCPLNQLNGTCLARLNSQCFSAVEEVFNPANGKLEDERTYGCLPPEESGFLQCKGNLAPHQVPKSIACCDSGDMCNKFLHPVYIVKPTDPNTVYGDELLTFSGPFHLAAFIVAAGVCFIILIFLILYVLIMKKRKSKDIRRNYLDTERSKGYVGTGESLRELIDQSLTSGSGSGLPLLVQRTIGKQLEMIGSIGKGRYGEVWKAKYREEDIAVKIFFTSEEASWFRETEIYQTTCMRNENILGFIAADIRGTGSWTQLLLITDYHEHGSLYDYLKLHILDVTTLLRLAYSAACGLAYLHAEIISRQEKPAIAHRDIKTKNILVKKDLTCAIGDFGLAVRYNREANELDVAANTRVGTIRYMAPEVLTETLQTSSFDAYRMADMYSFGLVLWEMARRCAFAYGIVEEYQLPFFDCVPSNPGYEDMKKVVYVDNTRPEIPNQWSMCEALQVLGKVMQECWHPSSGARLSSLRVKKTLLKLLNNNRDIKVV